MIKFKIENIKYILVKYQATQGHSYQATQLTDCLSIYIDGSSPVPVSTVVQLNSVNASYSFTQFSTLAKIYTITAREPSIYISKCMYVCILSMHLGTAGKIRAKPGVVPPFIPKLVLGYPDPGKSGPWGGIPFIMRERGFLCYSVGFFCQAT